MSIVVRARFDVRVGGQAEFAAVVRALLDQTKSEPGTLAYRWFAAGPGSYVVLEEYADTAAALVHNERGAPLLERVAQCADMVYAELYGSIGPELHDWAQSDPHVTVFPTAVDLISGTPSR